MLTFLLIVILIAFLVGDYFLAKEFYQAAAVKGWPDKKYYWYALLLPLGGHLLIIALPDRAGAGISAMVSDDLPEL